MGKSEGVTNPRRSKRQKGLDVSPVIVTKPKKNKPEAVLTPVTEADIEKTMDAANEQEVNLELPGDESSHLNDDKILDDDEEEEVQTSQQLEEDVVEPSTDRVTNPSEEVQTQQSEEKNRKTRGPTKMRKVAKHLDDKVSVEFTALGEHVGIGSVKLSSFLGALVREHVPLILDDWRHLDDLTRDALWEEIPVYWPAYLINKNNYLKFISNSSNICRGGSMWQKIGTNSVFSDRWVVCGGVLNLGLLPKFELRKLS